MKSFSKKLSQTILIIVLPVVVLAGVFIPQAKAIVDINNVTVSNIKIDSVVVRWDSTASVGTSQIDYGTSASYGSTTSEDPLSYYHDITLSGLSSGTTYHYRIRSKDFDGALTTSPDYTFTVATQSQLDAAFAADIAQRKTQGNVYFVRTDGNDSCTGKQNLSYAQNYTECAFLTIPKAVAVAISGDSIIVMAGDYALSQTINITKSNISLIGKDMPCVRQSDINNKGFSISNASNVTVQGFCLKNLSVGIEANKADYLLVKGNNIETVSTCYQKPDRTGILVSQSSHILVTENKTMTTGSGIAVTGQVGYQDIKATHNTIDIPNHQTYCEDGGMGLLTTGAYNFNCGAAFNEWGAPQICGYAATNLEMSYNKILGANRNCLGPGGVQNAEIHHNFIDRCDHNGIDLHGTLNANVFNNTVLDMTQGDSSTILISDGYFGGGKTWAQGAPIVLAKNLNIYNNYFHNKLQGGIFNWGNPFDVTLYNNIIVNEAPGGLAYFGDPWMDFPRFCYGVRFIKNRIISNNSSGSGIVNIDCYSAFPSNPQIPAFMDRNKDSNIYMDNDFTSFSGACFSMGTVRDTFYLVNNKFNCKEGNFTFNTGSTTASGNINQGYYLNIKTVDENSNSISGAKIIVEPTVAGYQSYSLAGVYDANGFPLTDNTHQMTVNSTTYTESDGYSPDPTNPAGVIVLLDKNLDFSSKINQSIAWKISITKDGYYPKTFFYSVGQDDYKQDLKSRNNTKTVTLIASSSIKIVFGDLGKTWNQNVTLSDVLEDKADNHLELNQEVGDAISWWKFDQSQGLGVFDSIGNRQGIFTSLSDNVSWVSGKYGTGLKFFEKGQRIDQKIISFHHDDAFDAKNESTSCATMWINPETSWNDGKIHEIIQESNGGAIWGGGKGWSFSKSSFGANGLNLRLMKAPSQGYDAQKQELTWLANNWHFLAYCFNETQAKIWKDSSPGTMQNINITGPVSSQYPIWIGNSKDNIIYDDFRLYNRWLTDADVQKIKANTYKSQGTVVSSRVTADNGQTWKQIMIRGDMPVAGSVSLKINTSTDGVTYSSVLLDDNATLGYNYSIPIDYQKKYAYFEITLKTTDLSYSPKISNVILSTDQDNSIVSVPVFSPVAGTYSSAQTVSISTATSGAIIRYTTNGTTPTESSSTYSNPLNISSTTTLKAGAWKSGMTSSIITSATYNIAVPVLTSIAVSPTTPSVPSGTSQTFIAQGKDQFGANIVATVTWSSSNPSVGTINSSGVFTANSQGTTTITATSGSLSGTATAIVTAAPPVPKAWLDPFWLKRKSISLTGYSSSLIDYPVALIVDTASLISASKLRSDCADMRFASSDNSSSLSYWIESGCNSSTTKVWVKIILIPTAGTSIYFYYNNSLAVSASNGDSTFDFFDDFTGTDLDTSKWTFTGTASVNNSEVLIGNNSNIQTKNNYSYNKEFVTKVKYTAGATKSIFRLNGSNYANYIRVDSFGDYSGGETYTVNSAGNIESYVIGATGGLNYHNWSILRNGINSVDFKKDGVLLKTHNVKIPIVDMPLQFKTGANNTTTVDYVYVRQYFSFEPILIIGQEETSSSNFPPVFSSPSTPQTFSVVAGDSTVSLSWLAPSSNGDSAITSYKVYRSSSSGTETLLTAGGCSNLENVLTCIDANLTNGTTYYYQVTALNSIGESPRSNEAVANPQATKIQGTVSNSSSVPIVGATVQAGINSTVTDSSGAYSLSVSTGTYTVTVTASSSGYASQSKSASVITAQTTTVNFTLTSSSSFSSADLNSDGSVNAQDFAILMSAWNSSAKPKADINQDGLVDSLDFGLMMSFWG